MASTLVVDALRLTQFKQADYTAIDFDTDTLYFMLVTSTGDAVADATKQGYEWESDANANEIAGSGGYTTRGQALTSEAVTQTSHVVKITSANPQWTTATITSNGGYYLKHTGSAATSPLVSYHTFGGAFTSTSGTFTVTVNASGWVSVS